MAIELKTIEINRHPIRYLEAGNSKSPTLILLTGWAQDFRLFKNVVPLLAYSFHVLSPDWRGHDPERTLHGDFTNADLVADLGAFIDATGVRDKYRTVSHSHGCWVNIEHCDRVGVSEINRTILIDWLMEPPSFFMDLVAEGQDPARYEASRKKLFDEWASTTKNEDVLNHIYNEMPSFGGEMWMRANREIGAAYTKWGSALKRMEAMRAKPQIMHIFSQPLMPEYREMQKGFAATHPWFHPKYLPGETHFPSLENGEGVARLIRRFMLE